MTDIQVIGIKFVKPNQFGDFEWMCHQPEYYDSLFVFNDNEEFHQTNKKGAGNAVMRKYNKYSTLNIPKSAGIPTGTMKWGGYEKLDAQTKTVIDDSIDEIYQLIEKYKYKRLFFSCEPDGKLGTSIFEVNPNVINYITSRIYDLTTGFVQIVKILPNDFFEDSFYLENEKEDNDKEDNDDKDDKDNEAKTRDI